MATGAPYTATEIERALALFSAGTPWPEVARLMGRPKQSLVVTACRYRRGLWAPKQKVAQSQALEARIETLVASGVTSTATIAQHVGMTRPAISTRLARMGLDVEMRRELAGAGDRP